MSTGKTLAPPVATPTTWLPIESAPTDNTRLLYLARFDDKGELQELDFGATWEFWQESPEMPEICGYYWACNSDFDESTEWTHWAYQNALAAVEVFA